MIRIDRARLLSLAILCCSMLGCVPVIAATNVDLDGRWQFQIDPRREGVAQGWSTTAPGTAETVSVPHTWNIGTYDDYEGTAWYFKSFEFPDELRARHVELNFGATFYRTRVWLNGVELGGHEGGFTAYHFDVTPHLKRFNNIAVEIDNTPGAATIPGWALRLGKANESWYDWWHYGGIVRDVWLSASDPAFVRRQQIRVNINGTAAEVSTRVFLENFSGRLLAARLKAKVLSSEGNTVAAVDEIITLKPGAQEQILALRIEGVKLWHFDHPNLYRLELELLDGRGKTTRLAQ